MSQKQHVIVDFALYAYCPKLLENQYIQYIFNMIKFTANKIINEVQINNASLFIQIKSAQYLFEKSCRKNCPGRNVL